MIALSKKYAFAILVISILGGLAMKTAHAQGSDMYVGQLMLVPYDFCPRGWAEANGQLLPITANDALFALIGCTFGGDCVTTFALPDMRGRVVAGRGKGPGLPPVEVGDQGGSIAASLTVDQMPAHTHGAETTVKVQSQLFANVDPGSKRTPDPANAAPATHGSYAKGGRAVAMSRTAIKTQAAAATNIKKGGAGQPIDVRDPYIGMRWCIAIAGIFPSRN